MKFESLARGVDIGAHCYLIESGGTRIILDAGTHPQLEGPETLPQLDRLGDQAVDGIIVTHAHLDHIGALPVVCRLFPEAPAISTLETLTIGEAMLHNSVNVMTAQQREHQIAAYPLYTHREVEQLRDRWQTVPFGRPISLGGASAELLPAGHVLGAAGVRLDLGGRTVFYTGDVHFEDQSLCRGADFSALEGSPLDTLIVETTRGAAGRRPDYSRRSEMSRFFGEIRETIRRGGSVLIPVFAYGKTQELLALLLEGIQGGDLPGVPIHLGGLGTKISLLFDRLRDHSRRLLPGLELLRDVPGVKLPSRRNPEPEFAPGRIYALTSGMMSEHTVSNRFARHVLADPKSAVLFIGYADPDSPGGRILASATGDRVSLNDSGKGRLSRVNCRIESFDFSGHAPRDQLLGFILRQRPRHTVLVHGDQGAREWFASELRHLAPAMRVTIPNPAEPIDLGS